MIENNNITIPTDFFELNCFGKDNNLYFSLIDMNEILFQPTLTNGQGGTISFLAKKNTLGGGFILNFNQNQDPAFQISSNNSKDIVTILAMSAIGLSTDTTYNHIKPANWNHYIISTERFNGGFYFKFFINGILENKYYLGLKPFPSFQLVAQGNDFGSGSFFPADNYYSDFVILDRPITDDEARKLAYEKELSPLFYENTLIHFKGSETEVIQDYNFYRKTNNTTTFDAEFQSVERFETGIVKMETLLRNKNTVGGISNQRGTIDWSTVDYAYNMIGNRLRIFENGTNRLDQSGYENWYKPYYIEKTPTEVNYYKDGALERTVADATDKIIDVKVHSKNAGEFISLDGSKITPTNIVNVEFFDTTLKNYAKNYNSKPKPKSVLTS